jgi:hypothetical protein
VYRKIQHGLVTLANKWVGAFRPALKPCDYARILLLLSGHSSSASNPDVPKKHRPRLAVLGGQQQWWLQTLLMRMSSDVVFVGAIALTAFTDNAALTYLGSLVEGLSPSFQYALVAGAVTGGGLTIIANAPNPAGIAILRQHFDEGVVHPMGLLVAALPPTLVAAAAFWIFR